MYGTGCKGGWVMCSLMNLQPVNLKQVQHNPCLIKTFVNIVLTENDVQDESDDETEEEIPSASAIKTSVEFLAMIDQQKAFLKRNELPTEIVEQLEAQVVAMQVSLCSKQKQMQDYFQSSPRAPTPSKEPRARTPIKDVSFKTVADVTKDVSLVDLIDMDDMELESIDTTIASVAVSAPYEGNSNSLLYP